MTRPRCFLLLFAITFSSSLLANGLCRPDGTPFPNYIPVDSTYFNAQALTGSYAPLVVDEILTNPTQPGFGLLHDENSLTIIKLLKKEPLKEILQNFHLPPAQYRELLDLAPASEIDQNLKPSKYFIQPQQELVRIYSAKEVDGKIIAIGPEIYQGDQQVYYPSQNRIYEIYSLARFSGTERVIAPPPGGAAGDSSRIRPLSTAEEKDLLACRNTITLAKSLESDSNPSILTPHEACALLLFEKNCLTNEDFPDSFENKISYRRAVVGLTSRSGQPYCMGTLVNQNSEFRIITSRHCFIDRASGKISQLLKLRSGKTLDENRIITIQEEDLQSLELPCTGNCDLPKGTYGPEKDAITIKAYVQELSGAEPLPEVRIDPALKGCIAENGDQNNECSRVLVMGVVPDLLTAKKLESQATNSAITGSWLDEVRWSKWLGGYTRLNYLEEHCAYYTSQTVKGFSGAPLITRTTTENGKEIIYIAGVHSGAYSSARSSWPACKTSINNPSAKRLGLNIADTEVDKP